MPSRPFNAGIWASIALAGLAQAHMAAWVKGMYCLNGTEPGVVNLNNNAPVRPLYNLTYDEFWLHAINKCNQFPPDEGDYVIIPSGKSFKVELADNRAFTSLNPHAKLTPWGDGLNHPADYGIGNLGGLEPTPSGCIPSPNLHAQNQSMAAGTAFAISYTSNINEVTPSNTVVFTVRSGTPYKREVEYDVPSGMPPCPVGGCHAIWLWIPNGCGLSNIYIFVYKAMIIPDTSSPKTIGTPKPAVWCEHDKSKCVPGPKQPIIWHQADSNNIEVKGYDLSGHPKSPGYNAKCGFEDGAQNDIFVDSNSADSSAHSKRMTRRGKKNVF